MSALPHLAEVGRHPATALTLTGITLTAAVLRGIEPFGGSTRGDPADADRPGRP